MYRSLKTLPLNQRSVSNLEVDSGVKTKDKIRMLLAEIDSTISKQLNLIIHHQDFQKVESSWKSLAYLSALLPRDVHTRDKVRIRLLNISKDELAKDFRRSMDFDHSFLFNAIYSKEFGTPGGVPFSMLIGDYEFGIQKYSKIDDVEILRQIAGVAAAAFCPFIAGASPHLLSIDKFDDLRIGKMSNFPIEYSEEFESYRKLRKNPGSRFLGLVLPKFLLRRIKGRFGSGVSGLNFVEKASSSSDRLWANASFAFAAIAIRSFLQRGWFLEMRGFHHKNHVGGEVPLIELESYLDRAKSQTPRVQVLIGEELENRLSQLGLIPLCQLRNSDKIAFFSNQSIQQCTQSEKTSSDSFEIGTMLQYILCVSRFAHFIKILVRDKIGSFQTEKQCENWLSSWIRDYISSNPNSSNNQRFVRPLREASVKITSKPESPGSYQCTIHLAPHCQMEHIASSLKLVTELTLGEVNAGA